jgi:hypothetical protein
MVGPEVTSDRMCEGGFVMGRRGGHDRERLHRSVRLHLHERNDRRRIDTSRQERPKGHICEHVDADRTRELPLRSVEKSYLRVGAFGDVPLASSLSASTISTVPGAAFRVSGWMLLPSGRRLRRRYAARTSWSRDVSKPSSVASARTFEANAVVRPMVVTLRESIPSWPPTRCSLRSRRSQSANATGP